MSEFDKAGKALREYRVSYMGAMVVEAESEEQAKQKVGDQLLSKALNVDVETCKEVEQVCETCYNADGMRAVLEVPSVAVVSQPIRVFCDECEVFYESKLAEHDVVERHGTKYIHLDLRRQQEQEQ